MSSPMPSPALMSARLTAKAVELETKLRDARRENRELQQKNAKLADEVLGLKERQSELLEEIKRLLRGARCLAPTLHGGQGLLFTEALEQLTDEVESLIAPEGEADLTVEVTAEDAQVPDAETPEKQGKNKPRDRSRRQRDESNLRTEVRRTELPPEERRCPTTGVELVEVGVKTTSELDYRPAELVRIEHQRVVYGPPPDVAKDREIAPLTAPAPSPAVEGVTATAALLAWLLCQKYVLHLPLYRQEDAFARLGVRLSRKTLCDWVLKAGFALRPVADAIGAAVRAGPVLQIDDTPIKIMRPGPGGGRNKLRQSYLWTLANPEVPGVAFQFTEGRSTEDVVQVLAPCTAGGSVQVLVGDGYASNRSGAREVGLDVAHGGCWAHVLRKFRDAMTEAPRAMALFLSDIGKIYELEARAREEDLDDEARLALRRAESLPIVVDLMRQTRGWREDYSLSGKVAEAMRYVRSQRRALLSFVRDGRVPIDNNVCERAIRPVAVGRSNWLFAGSVEGAGAAAVIYTLTESAKRSGVDPLGYLEAVLGRVGTWPASRVAELTPWEMASALPPYRHRDEAE